ncbi:hypothetical protein CF319_g4580 [Tilletia indica]|nr:hypothetical protein CF319_g4580 [Tilletia indica]
MKRGDNANGTYLSYPFNYPAAPQTKGNCTTANKTTTCTFAFPPEALWNQTHGGLNGIFITPCKGNGSVVLIGGAGGLSYDQGAHAPRFQTRRTLPSSWTTPWPAAGQTVVLGSALLSLEVAAAARSRSAIALASPATEGKFTTTWKGGDASPDLKYVTGGGGGGLLGGVAGEAGNGGYAGESLGDIIEERGGNNEQAGSAVIKFTCF